MRTLLKISPDNLAVSRQSLENVMEKMESRLADHQFLVADQFSRADLAIAALFSPLCKPTEMDDLADNEPAAFAALKQSYQEKLPWVAEIYRQFR